jgi:hypothetical protein
MSRAMTPTRCRKSLRREIRLATTSPTARFRGSRFDLAARKPKLDTRSVEDLQLYNTDDLRHLYHYADGGNELIRLRDGIISRDELKAVILRRLWWDRCGYFVLLAVSVIGVLAAVIAAVEGWPRHIVFP